MTRAVLRVLGGIVAMVAATLLYGFNWPLGQARAASATSGPPSQWSREQFQAFADASDAGRQLTITGLDVRGTMLRAVARVEYQVNGTTPPDGRPVRYLLLRQSGFGDWMVDRGSTALSYYFLF